MLISASARKFKYSHFKISLAGNYRFYVTWETTGIPNVVEAFLTMIINNVSSLLTINLNSI